MRDFPIEDKSRIGVLDGLRALAICLVLARHSVRAFWPDLTQPFFPIGPVDLGTLFINGWMGVDLFFVLSGFLITSHLLSRHFDAGGKLVKPSYYMQRRFFRIAPAYYLVLTLVCLGAFPFFPYPESDDNLGVRYVYHLLFMQDYFPSDIVVVFWSLAVEIKYYLLAPFLIWLLLRFKSARVRMGLLALMIAAQPVLRMFVFEQSGMETLKYHVYFLFIRSAFHICLDGLLLGTLCAVAMRDEPTRRLIERKSFANGLFFAGLAGFLVLALQPPLVDLGAGHFEVTLMSTLISLSFAAMMLGLLGGCAGARWFRGRMLTFIALISYSLYLIHLPLLYAAEIVARKFFSFESFAYQIQYLLYLPFFLVITFTAASLMYFFVEKPFIDWSHRRTRL